MTHPVPASPHRRIPKRRHALTLDDPEAERLAAEGWPVLRGTSTQRDARFVEAVLTAQLALARGRQ